MSTEAIKISLDYFQIYPREVRLSLTSEGLHTHTHTHSTISMFNVAEVLGANI